MDEVGVWGVLLGSGGLWVGGWCLEFPAGPPTLIPFRKASEQIRAAHLISKDPHRTQWNS